MKRTIAIALVMLLAFMAAGCVGETGEPSPELLPQNTISQPSMDIQPIEPGQSLPQNTEAQPTETPGQPAETTDSDGPSTA